MQGSDHYIRIFTCSLSDFFHADISKAVRDRAWRTIKNTPNCVYLILTKRPENIKNMLPADWGAGYPNVWLGTSVGCKQTLSKLDSLRKVPCALRFVSCEPLLEDIASQINLDGIGWVIVGGESGSEPEYLWADAMAGKRVTSIPAEQYRKMEAAGIQAGDRVQFAQSGSLHQGIALEFVKAKKPVNNKVIIKKISHKPEQNGKLFTILSNQVHHSSDLIYKDWRDEMNRGEEGRRKMDLEWAYNLLMLARAKNIPFFFKQISARRSGKGGDWLGVRAEGKFKYYHEFPDPPNGGVWVQTPEHKPTQTEKRAGVTSGKQWYKVSSAGMGQAAQEPSDAPRDLHYGGITVKNVKGDCCVIRLEYGSHGRVLKPHENQKWTAGGGHKIEQPLNKVIYDTFVATAKKIAASGSAVTAKAVFAVMEDEAYLPERKHSMKAYMDAAVQNGDIPRR